MHHIGDTLILFQCTNYIGFKQEKVRLKISTQQLRKKMGYILSV